MTAPPAPPTRRGDASVELLRRIMDDSLDPGYAAAAHRAVSPGHRNRGWIVAPTLVVVGLLFTVAALQVQRSAPDAERTRIDLQARVSAATARTDGLAARLDSLQQEVAGLRSLTLAETEVGRRLDGRLVAVATAAARTPLAGPGVVVTLDDAPAGSGDPNLTRVLDRDLQVAVNGLFASGAEAVAVNEQRIDALAAIRGAGDAILVGYRPLTRPYVVTALGDPRTLEAQFVAGQAGRELRTVAGTYGLRFETTTEPELQVPAAPDATLRYARPKEPA